MDDSTKPKRVPGLARLAREWRDSFRLAHHCRDLHALFLQVRDSHPELAGEALYVQVVRQHLNLDPDGARKLVAMASKSYATWPMPRPVAFRDVAHYLIVDRLSECRGWVDLTVTRAVNGRIPSDW